MKPIIYALIGTIALFATLNLVDDQPPPQVVFTSQAQALSCPIKNGC